MEYYLGLILSFLGSLRVLDVVVVLLIIVAAGNAVRWIMGK